MPNRTATAEREIRGAVEFAAGGFDRITARVHELHRAIAGIPFDRMKPVPVVTEGSESVRAVHDGITDTVYGAIRLGARALFGAAGLALRGVEAVRPVEERAPSRVVDDLESAANALFGDWLASQHNPIAVRPGFYAGGRRLVLNSAALAAAQSNATGRLAIFVHGLACNENAWTLYRDELDSATRTYAEQLREELDFTPYFARYNTGMHVSQNGRQLSRAIERLVQAHPVPVSEIVLIGHSMGGLVSRAACDAALRRDAGWTAKLKHVICLGTPHLGAPLEKVVHVGAALLERFAVTRPFAHVLHDRSLGIQDLRHGYTADADWRGRDPKRQYEARRTLLRRVPGARVHFIGSTIGAPEGLVARAIGDGLVRLPSSTARELADADTAVLHAINHLRLLNHPEVYAQIRDRLEMEG